MKISLKNFRVILWIILGVAITFSSLVLNRPISAGQDVTTTPTALVEPVESASDVHEDVGSTDGIMLVAVMIVLVIVIPILLQRETWSNGKPGKSR